jgi:hypothetical protein
MAMPKDYKGPTVRQSWLYNTTRGNENRQCNRPERVPGVAPACEDDKDDNRKTWGFASSQVYRAPVSLPRLKFLELTENV